MIWGIIPLRFDACLSMTPECNNETDSFIPIQRIGIVGKNGQIGGMLAETLSGSDVSVYTAGRGEVSQLMALQPEVVFLATPKPIGEIIHSVVDAVESPALIVLLQNGVGVVEEALPHVHKTQAAIIRAGIFTPVSRDQDGLKYNDRKLRIAMAPIPDMPPASIPPLTRFLEQSGFTVRMYEDYRSLEWTKLVLNCLGATSTVTGLTPYETFTDNELFSWELRGIKDRLRTMRHLGIPFASVPWGKTNLLKVAVPVLPDHPFGIIQRTIAHIIAKGRENMPSSAARKIASGHDISEVLEYHRPFIDTSPVDAALYRLILGHQQRAYSFSDMPYERKRSMLRDHIISAMRHKTE